MAIHATCSHRRRLADTFRYCAGLVLAAVAISSSGCTSTYNDNWLNHCNNECCFDQVFIGWRDHVWAKRAFHRCYPACDHLHASHFRRGFMAGYTAVCDGQDAYLPAVAPEEYWGYRYQSAEGGHMVNAWFEGYPEGVRAAAQDGVGSYRDLQIPDAYNEFIDPSTNAWDAYLPAEGETVDPQGIPLPESEAEMLPEIVTPEASLGYPTEYQPPVGSQPVEGTILPSSALPSNVPITMGQRWLPWGVMR